MIAHGRQVHPCLAVGHVPQCSRSAHGWRRRGSHPQVRTWLLIGVIFGVVSAWLFYQG